MSAAQVSLAETASGYRHEAFLYSGMAEFVTGTVSFIRRAVRAGDPILVVVSQAKIDVLRRELRADAERVSFADMTDVGDNPARIMTERRRSGGSASPYTPSAPPPNWRNATFTRPC
jgi:hypothetical protein